MTSPGSLNTAPAADPKGHARPRFVASPRPSADRESVWLVGGTVLLGCAIFLVDTFSSREFAVAVLYVVIVVIATRYQQRRIVQAVAITCAAATIVSFVIMHKLMPSGTAPLRAVVSLAAIGVTARMAIEKLDLGIRLRATTRERTNLARFLPEQMIEEIVDSEAPLTMARQGPAAVLFADMVGFTSRTASLPPAQVIALVRRLTDLYGTSIAAHQGTIDKFLGDGVLGVFGLPRRTTGDTSNAVLCAFHMLTTAECWNQDHAEGEFVELAIGIHQGEVIQGDIGSDHRLELTVVGDVVNIASRLEGRCRSLGASILVTEAVVAALHAEGRPDLAGSFRDLGPQELRGRADAIRAFALMGAVTAQRHRPA